MTGFRRLVLAGCLLIAGFGGIGLGSAGHALAGGNACGKGVDLCITGQTDGNTWILTIYGYHLAVGTYVTYSYSSTSGGGGGGALVGNGGKVVFQMNNDSCPGITINASASGTTAKGAPVGAVYHSVSLC